jgi:predicted permease
MSSRWFTVLRARVRSLLQREQVDAELARELLVHLEHEEAENQRKGMAGDEARYAARRRLGGVSQIEEECRDTRRLNFMETLKQDLRYGLRTLLKSPGFTLVMLLTLALSIGATSAIVSVVNGVMLRKLPYKAPEQLVRFFLSSSSWPKFAVNPYDFRDFRARLDCFESMAAYTRANRQLGGKGEAIRVSGFAVTSGFFHVLGVRPAMGREFDRSDELAGKGNSVIISDRIWRTRLGSRRDVVGQKLDLDAIPYTVVGVMPAGTQHPGNMYHAVAYGDTVDFWIPFTYQGREDRGSHYMDAIARLKTGVTVGEAQSTLNAGMRRIMQEEGADGWTVIVVPLDKEIVGRSERLLFVLLSVVLLVLLLACVNAANLLLARATARQREIAVRAAVGAGRNRLIRQLLTESALLAIASGVVGAVLMVLGVRALVSLMPADFPRIGDIHVDLPVFLFTLILSLGTGLLFGIIPALQASQVDLRDTLHEQGRGSTSSSRVLRLRNALVISEVALACILLIGAGLLLRSFLSMLHTNPGFQPEQVLTASISLPQVSYKEVKDASAFYRQLLSELRAQPAIRAAGVSSDLPWNGWDENAGGFLIQGEVAPPKHDFHARYHMASAGYFEALGIPLRRGRYFDGRDAADQRKTIIINDAMARYWKHGDALGGKFTFADHPKESDWFTVVGIVGDVKDTPKSMGAEPGFWWPLEQTPMKYPEYAIAIRSSLTTQATADRLHEAVRQLNPNLAISEIKTMQVVADGSFATPRFGLAIVAMFAGLAVVLAAIGTYGVISYSVNQRLHEFGVRMAVGASPMDVVRGVLSGGLKLALIGTLCGVVLGVALARLLGNLLYGVGSADPIAIVATCSIILLIAGLACYIPAWRASRADPMSALRAD